ncbi:glycoside hydrolase [Coniella lustricola]|uniref:chitinase n=1 Tax=Coniella lustricola TaxID=2025994 RepID=A0A2T2ZYK9_9PEZI|nr:glycoside hydrolase [Coniella lustricola]
MNNIPTTYPPSRKSRKAASLSQVYFSNAVYFPNHRIYNGDTPGSMNYNCISTVYYCFANVATDGGVFLSDEYADVRSPCDGVSGGLGSLMHLKQKHPHLQVILSVGGPHSSQIFATVAASAVLRDNFARSCKDLVDASGLDGIDIVWQWPMGALQGANFVALLAAIRMYLPEEHYLLTAALPAAQVVLSAIDVQRAAEYLDLLNLMAFDMYGAWSSRSGHHAQLYPATHKEDESFSGSFAVSCLLSQGFPAKKILFGIPCFGRHFPGVTSTGQSFSRPSGDGTVDYLQLPRKGSKEIVDRRACAAFCVGSSGSSNSSGFITYDNPETVKAKAAFVKQKGLGGLFYWTGPADAKDGKRSLIASGFKALHSSG